MPVVLRIRGYRFWFFSMMWENGRSQPPLEYVDDRSVVGLAE